MYKTDLLLSLRIVLFIWKLDKKIFTHGLNKHMENTNEEKKRIKAAEKSG